MKKTNIISGIMLSMITVMLSGCAYTHIQTPMDRDYANTQLGTKEGSASNRTVLYLVAWGDAGSKAAAENGNITIIRHADQRIFSILFGLYTKVTTVVYGD